VPWYVAALRTDRGQVREENQDAVCGISALLPRPSPAGVSVPFGFFAVADGMGGLSDGAQASTTATRLVSGHVVTALLGPALAGVQRDAGQGTVADILRAGMQEANAAIHRRTPRGVVGGTTFSCALLLGHQLTIAHVGDSRIYLAGPDGLRRLTSDHSMVARLIEMGQMLPEEVYNNPQRNSLYRSLGLAPQVEVETASYAPGQATHLLLCSDGLWDVVGDAALAAAVAEEASIEALADRLVAQANGLGGPDNISVIVVRL
jgi:serine/threonine protein phosphatase PrpC